MGACGKQPQPNNLPTSQQRSNVRKKLDTTTAAARSKAPAGSMCMWPSTTTRASPSRPSIQTKEGVGTGLPACCAGVLRPAWHHLQGHPDRQRTGLPFPIHGCRLQAPCTQAPLPPSLHPAHQRQGRTLHPDRAPRMGLRTVLPKLQPTQPGASPLAASVQLAPAPC